MKVIKVDLSKAEQAADYIFLMSLYARDPMGGGQDLSEDVKAKLPEALASRENIIVFIAYDGEGQPIGLATAIEGFSTFACQPLLNIHDVIIVPEQRGQGLAGKLLFIVEAEAKKRGCCKLTLEVLQGNASAEKAYTNSGFEPYQLDEAMGKAEFWEKKF